MKHLKLEYIKTIKQLDFFTPNSNQPVQLATTLYCTTLPVRKGIFYTKHDIQNLYLIYTKHDILTHELKTYALNGELIDKQTKLSTLHIAN